MKAERLLGITASICCHVFFLAGADAASAAPGPATAVPVNR